MTFTTPVAVQLRDPLMQYQPIGGPFMVLVHATPAGIKEDKYKVTSLHAGGLKARLRGKRNTRDSKRQRLTAMQWLVVYGLGTAGKKAKHVFVKGQELLWIISSGITAEMWLKPTRNPDVRFNSKLQNSRKCRYFWDHESVNFLVNKILYSVSISIVGFVETEHHSSDFSQISDNPRVP